VEIVVKLS
jgi:hypothetical protein